MSLQGRLGAIYPFRNRDIINLLGFQSTLLSQFHYDAAQLYSRLEHRSRRCLGGTICSMEVAA